MKIMLIDDDEAIRMMLQDIIEDYNLGEVAVSLDSAATLNNGLLALHHIDILIIDIGHYETEECAKDIFYRIITDKFAGLTVYKSEVGTNPVHYYGETEN